MTGIDNDRPNLPDQDLIWHPLDIGPVLFRDLASVPLTDQPMSKRPDLSVKSIRAMVVLTGRW